MVKKKTSNFVVYLLIGIVALATVLAMTIRLVSSDVVGAGPSPLAAALVKFNGFCEQEPKSMSSVADLEAAIETTVGHGLFEWTTDEKEIALQKLEIGHKTALHFEIFIPKSNKKICLGLLPFIDSDLPSHIKIRMPPTLFLGLYFYKNEVLAVLAAHNNQQYSQPLLYASVIATQVSATQSLFALKHTSLNELSQQVLEMTGLNTARGRLRE